MVYSDRLVPSTIRWNPLLLTCVPRRRTHTLRQSQRRSDDAFSSFVSGYGQESLTKCTANQLNINSTFNMVNHSQMFILKNGTETLPQPIDVQPEISWHFPTLKVRDGRHVRSDVRQKGNRRLPCPIVQDAPPKRYRRDAQHEDAGLRARTRIARTGPPYMRRFLPLFAIGLAPCVSDISTMHGGQAHNWKIVPLMNNSLCVRCL